MLLLAGLLLQVCRNSLVFLYLGFSAGAMVMEGEGVKEEGPMEETMGATEVSQQANTKDEEAPDSVGDVTEANAVKFFDAGCNALKSGDYDEAADALAKALQIRVELYGELAPECALTYYEYGCALLQKVQSERDPLGNTKEAETVAAEGDDEPTDNQGDAEQDSEPVAKSETAEVENGHEDGDDVQDEEETELELAWKVMDIARVIHEKQRTHSLDEVDVHLALADISLEKEDFQTCFEDYNKALEILKGLVDPDNRRLAEAYFKMALAKQFAKAPMDAISYCQQAASVCELRVERLKREIADDGPEKAAKQEEVQEMGTLLADLNEKVEELKNMSRTPSILDALQDNSELAETLRTAALKAATKCCGELAPSTSTGVVGRGIKRAAPVPVSDESSSKRLESES